MKEILLIFISCIFSLESCKEVDKGGICSAVFASVSVTIKNGASTPLSLDSFKVMRVIDNTDMTVKFSSSEFEFMQKSGSYPITNDSYMGQLSNKNIEVVFMGSKGGKIVVNRKYSIGADQCHVKLIAGNPQVVID
jgi:hypothetical protein